MKHIIALARNSFKKNVKTLLSFSIILLIASMLFGSALVIRNNFSKDYDKRFNELNTANAFFTVSKADYNDSILDDIKNISNIKEVEARKGILVTIPVKTKNSIQDQEQVFYDIGDNGNISKYEIIEKNSESSNNYIYLSNYTYINSNIELTDNFSFNINDKNYVFPIGGIIEEMQYGNYSSEILGQFLSSSAYQDLLEDNESNEVITIAIKSDNSYETYNKVSKLLNDRNIIIYNRNYDEQSKNSRLAISNVLVLILTIFSFVILLVSLLVSKFKIEQSIEEEMSDMGVLKALGYTSKEIMVANILPYIISGLVFSFIGIMLSYAITPIFRRVIEMQTGFIWKARFDALSSGSVLIINMILITLFTVLAVRKIKKLNPINAIRGIENDKASKNHFEIDKTKVGIEFNLALKNYANSKSQNRLLGVVLFCITFIASFVGILFYNVNLNPINFINTLVEEHPNVAIVVNSDIKDKISKMNGVKNVIYYDENGSITYKDNLYKVFIAENFKNVSNDICYDGTNPSNEYEIAVGSKIKEMYDIKINDYIELTKNGVSKQYKVVGFIQSVNNSGGVFELTLDGYKNIDNNYIPKTMYIYLQNDKSAKDFIKDIEKTYNEEIVTTVNYDESMDSAMDMYVTLVRLISIIIIIITILLIYLILYIIISGIITKRKQELGILKSIGYKSKQLIFELIGGFIPSVIVSTTLGIVISKLFMYNIYKQLFKAVGAYKISFDYPIIIFFIVAFLLIVSTLLIANILARKIKKISVYSLIKD